MIQDPNLIVGRRLRHRRRLLGMTQAQVASVMGVRFQQVQKYESAANALTVPRLLQICAALDTTPSVVLDGVTLNPETQVP
jgi:transcriptional regulator with XRE-family HTH domain